VRTTQAGQSFLLLLDAIDVLKEHKVDYAVIGAMAASVHGVVRASLDADALLSLTAQSLNSLQTKFKDHGFKTVFRRGAPDDPIASVLALNDSYGNRVDLLAGIRGLDPEVFSRVVEVPFEKGVLRVIGLEDFIAMKIFAGGPQDLTDARRAIAVSSRSLNRPLLEQLTARFGKKYLRLLKSF